MNTRPHLTSLACYGIKTDGFHGRDLPNLPVGHFDSEVNVPAIGRAFLPEIENCGSVFGLRWNVFGNP